MFQVHLAAIIAHLTSRIRCTQDPYDKIARFTVAFSTLKGGDGLSRTPIQRKITAAK